MKFNKFIDLHRTMCNESYTSGQLPKSLQKLSIISSITHKKGFVIPIYKEVLITNGSFKLSYESMLPLLSLSGHELRIFLFLAAYYLEKDTCSFKWTDYVIDAYQDYYCEITGKSAKISTVKQAFKKLRMQNVIQRVSKEDYLMNPIYLPRTSSSVHNKKLFNEYTKKSTHGGKDALESLDYK